ncbi:hypothetical protein FIV42_22785 [Persicimonas caeni]|uniref:Toxin-antitoxin system YwqK family antitoxin n=1 Tax=Persicimonas caeni TaxID=2292766 RepID=A0A4Y6PYR5_PERCE|nr:hypothetical protein [Persicimonas caeni]QDG53466.1 hypothetical protein FIV42_22785 [Persicimonas caeni]QED34687.1 hypothetical protein FRD00_22780 [Persicimonas caeni]
MRRLSVLSVAVLLVSLLLPACVLNGTHTSEHFGYTDVDGETRRTSGKMTCDYVNGVPHGKCVVELRSGVTGKGTVERGLADGEWVWTDENGELMAKGSFVDDKPHGMWVYRNRRLKIGFTSREFAEAEGGWNNGKRSGTWTFVRTNGERIVANYTQGELDGRYEAYYASGQLERAGDYEAGDKVGVWKAFFPDGSLQTLTDRDAKKFERWTRPGYRRIEGTIYPSPRTVSLKSYKEWNKHLPLVRTVVKREKGPWRYGPKIDRQGREIAAWGEPCPEGTNLVGALGDELEQWCQLPAEDGLHKKHGPHWIWSTMNGRVISKGNYKNGERHGTWKTFWPTGGRWEVAEYVGGEKHGRYREYESDGRLKRQGDFKRGKRHGEWLYYNAAGQLEKKVEWANGKKR